METFPAPPELFTVMPGESFLIRRSSYFIQQDTPLPSLQRKIFFLLSVKSYSETEGEHTQHPCFPFGPAGGFPFIFMAKIPGSRDSGLPYPSHAVCFKTAWWRDEIAIAVNGFGNRLFPEIPQQFQPSIGKHGTVQYFHIPGTGGIGQSLGNICSTQEPYAWKGFRHPSDQFRFRFHRDRKSVV